MSDRGSVAGLGQNRAVLMAQTTKPEVAVASSLTVREVNLYTVLSDPSSLAYWLEHMERRFRSRLVQFWLTVEGLKDPLEAAAPDLALDSSINSLDDDSLVKDNPTLAEDVSFIYDAYFSDTKSNPIDIPQKHLTTIRLLATSPPDPLGGADVRRAKQAMFASQKAVYEQMREEDWGDFRKGELYLKAVTDLERSGVLPPLPTVPSPIAAAPAMPPSAAPSMLPPPIHPQRQVSAPIISAKRQPEMRSPSLRQGPTLLNGSITPSSATTPVASVSTTPPTFDLPAPEIRPRVASADERMSSSLSSLPSPPPAVPRRSSHLDFLIGSEAQEEDKERAKLFGDEDEEGEDDEDYVQVQRMEAIQAALNEIIASDDALGPRKEPVAATRMSPEPEDLKSPSASMILMGAAERPDPTLSKAASRSAEDLRVPQLPRLDTTSRVLSPVERKASDPPALPQRRSTSNLHGLQGGGARGKLFDDEVAEEDEVGDEDIEGEPIEVVQLAAPGDLQLSVEIARLQDKILDLVKQEHLLDSLIRQAELTGNQTELRILRRSQSSVRREQRTAIFQKAQFEQQEEENRLVPGRTKVDIPSAVVTTEEGEGKQVVRYTIEVKQIGEDGSVRVAWVVARRYNEFWELDRAIKEWAITSGDHALLEEVRWKIAELPGKKLVPNVSSSFIESRKLGLEKYLQVGTSSF
jgi:sorting nexin-25